MISRALILAPLTFALPFFVAMAVAASACSGTSRPVLASSPAAPAVTCGTGDSGTPGPTLSSLSISPLALVPAFSPCTHDYYVSCNAGTNELTVSMTSSAGATSALMQPKASPSSGATQTTTVRVSENEAIVAVAASEDGTSSSEYWVRCLPPDFPELQLEAHPEAGVPPPGYYLLGNSGPATGYAMVLDGNGVPVWYVANTASGVDDVDTVVNGAISYFLTWQTLPVRVQHLSPLMTTYAAPSGAELDTHELRVLSNGHYLALSYPPKTGVDLEGLSGLGFGVGEGANQTIVDCHVVEFDPNTGDIQWQWAFTDHFDPAQDSVSPAWTNLANGARAVDVWHCNSIDVDPTNGDLLVSARNMCSVFYIDRQADVVLWKMGGTSFSKDNATYVPVSDPFYQQHDARLLPGFSAATGVGQVSVFDDHSNAAGPARGIVLDVNTGVDGSRPAATLAWQYATQSHSADRGSFRILSDGSRIIGWGQNDNPQLGFTEVDLLGNDLLDFYFPAEDVSYRVIKVPLSTFELVLLRRTAGQL
jgi:hypothetical protein